MTNRATDVFTVTRAQQGTTAQAFNAQDVVENRPSAEFYNNLAQKADIQTLAGAFIINTGTNANALIGAYNPAVTTHVNGLSLTIIPTFTNTGDMTFNAGPGAIPVRKDVSRQLIGGDVMAGKPYTFVFYNNIWHLINYRSWEFPANTRMLFEQTTAPVLWVKELNATYNQAAIKLTTGTVGSGGSVNASTVFTGNLSTFSTALTAAMIPAHTHSFSGTSSGSGGHSHNFYRGNNSVVATARYVPLVGFYNAEQVSGSLSPGPMDAVSAHTHTFSGNTSSVGSGATHAHGIRHNMKYRDAIIARRA